jgi:hypothetical protein
MMDAYSSRLSQSIRDTLQNKIDDLSRALANTPCEDFSAYKFRCGIIKGLHDALEVVCDVERELNTPEKASESDAKRRKGYEE